MCPDTCWSGVKHQVQYVLRGNFITLDRFNAHGQNVVLEHYVKNAIKSVCVCSHSCVKLSILDTWKMEGGREGGRREEVNHRHSTMAH